MKKPDLMSATLPGFIVGDQDEVLAKLAKFKQAGPGSLHIVSDFDMTLTAGKLLGENIGTWDVMDELLPPEGVARHSAIYNSFRPTEIDGKLTDEVAQQKWSDTLDLFLEYPMSIDDIKQAFLSVAQLREGAHRLFTLCEEQAVPTVVLSSGIRNVIEIIAEHYGIHPTHILSNDLEFDAKTRLLTDWRRDSLIHMLNKNEMGHGELSALRRVRPHVLLLGDVPDDVKMVAGDDVIRVRVLDPRKGETHNLEQAAQASFEAGYDLVVEHSLEPVVRLLESLAGAGQIA